MNKSPQCNHDQQTEPNQCKSEVEEICSYSPNPGTALQDLHTSLKINSGFHARGNPSEVNWAEGKTFGYVEEKHIYTYC